MPRITDLKYHKGKNKDRVYVYIDNIFCTSIRERTWIGMNLGIGSEIDCASLKNLEENFWKKAYGEKSWIKEKYRLNRSIAWFNKYIPEVEAKIVGFGADNISYLENMHSDNKGEPDISIQLDQKEIIALEVSGTERQKGNDYWVRKDKIDYIQDNPNRDVWILLHYQMPKETFVWIKILIDKKYDTKIINIKGADEFYIIFAEDAEEIISSADFKNHILQKLSAL